MNIPEQEQTKLNIPIAEDLITDVKSLRNEIEKFAQNLRSITNKVKNVELDFLAGSDSHAWMNETRATIKQLEDMLGSGEVEEMVVGTKNRRILIEEMLDQQIEDIEERVQAIERTLAGVTATLGLMLSWIPN